MTMNTMDPVGVQKLLAALVPQLQPLKDWAHRPPATLWLKGPARAKTQVTMINSSDTKQNNHRKRESDTEQQQEQIATGHEGFSVAAIESATASRPRHKADLIPKTLNSKP